MNDKIKIALPANKGLLLVPKEDILYAIAEGNYTHIYLINGKSIKILKKLKQVTELLSDKDFIRIHRSYLINMEHVRKFEEGKTVVMSNDFSLTVSRSYKRDFKEKFIRL